MITPRIGAACGLLYAVLLMAAPSIGVTQVAAAALVLFVPFAAYLAHVLRDGGWLASTVFGAALVSVTIKLGSGAEGLAAENTVEGSAIDTVLHDMNDASFMLSMYPLAVVAGGTAIVALRTGALPRWLGWFSALTAVALAVNGSFLDSQFGPAILLFLAWTATLCIRDLVRGAPARQVELAAA